MQVAVRIRPLHSNENAEHRVVESDTTLNTIHLRDAKTKLDVRVQYDHLFAEHCQQNAVFQHLCPYTDYFLAGQHCTLFAYG